MLLTCTSPGWARSSSQRRPSGKESQELALAVTGSMYSHMRTPGYMHKTPTASSPGSYPHLEKTKAKEVLRLGYKYIIANQRYISQFSELRNYKDSNFTICAPIHQKLVVFLKAMYAGDDSMTIFWYFLDQRSIRLRNLEIGDGWKNNYNKNLMVRKNINILRKIREYHCSDLRCSPTKIP